MSIKKKAAVIITFVLIIVTFVLCFGAMSVKPVTGNEPNKITIVLDAGHGGIDGGVCGSQTGIKESEINLAIVKKLQGYLESGGFSVVLTRNSDEGLYGVATSSRKKKDMLKRKQIIEESNADLVVSIHQNFYSSESRRGAQVFYKPNDEKAKILSKCIQESYNSMEEAVRSCSPLTGDYYILNCSSVPSVICECGFLSNPSDEIALSTDEYREKIAYATFKGIISFFAETSSKFF